VISKYAPHRGNVWGAAGPRRADSRTRYCHRPPCRRAAHAARWLARHFRSSALPSRSRCRHRGGSGIASFTATSATNSGLRTSPNTRRARQYDSFQLNTTG
jgi:hypothetical protein